MTKTSANNTNNDPVADIRTVSKFAGEEFDVGNVRTVFAGASKDNMERKERVILLFGPTGSGKSGLIDCMCNYFYGAKFDGTRYKIADEIFDSGSTPVKSITKYVFNETVMPYRPVIIDTPEIASDNGIPTEAEIARMLHGFLVQSHHIRITAIGLVLKFEDTQLAISKEDRIKETINLFPRHMMPNTIILFSSSDEKHPIPSSIKSLLHYLNLSYNKYYFFNERFLHHTGKQRNDDEEEQRDEKSRWDLTMSELDRFFEHVRRLNPQRITEKNVPFDHDIMQQYRTTYTLHSNDSDRQSAEPQKSVSRERIIPVKLITQESDAGGAVERRDTFVKDPNSTAVLVKTPVIKRYVYDPGTMTHKEYVIKMQREAKLPAVEHIDVQSFGSTSGPFAVLPLAPSRPVHETLINDIPQENLPTKRPVEDSALPYRHIKSSPPPEYGIETITLVQAPDESKQGQTRIIEKRTSTTIDMDPQLSAQPQYSKSAVQRQIARSVRTSAEQPKSPGTSETQTDYRTPLSQQQQPPENVQIRQTEQVIERLADGVLSARNDAFGSGSQQRNSRQEQESYVITQEMKRSRSPIQVRLTMSKKERRPSSGSEGAQDQPDGAIEQPRTLETDIDRIPQSPLRSYGRMVREDELEEGPEGGGTQLAGKGVYDMPPNEGDSQPVDGSAEGTRYATGAGRAEATMPVYGAGERDGLLGVQTLNLEEGLTPHPYKSDSRMLLTKSAKESGARSLTIGKESYSSWDWINCCFFLLAPLFIIFIIIAIVITLAILA